MYKFFKINLLVIVCLLSLTVSLHAQDTTSLDDLQFTEISADSSGSAAATDTVIQSPAQTKRTSSIPVQIIEHDQSGLWTIFVSGLLGGLAALLMPCIFPMLPLTVSFFTKGAEKGQALKKALLYGFFIIAIYVVLGLLITIIFGADALNNLSTNGLFNFMFFLLLLAFAASFFGAFELTLPSSWINKMDTRADKGGIAGLFFMAGTLALVSFSCTGPIIGTLLVQAATTGALLGPAIGMLGFAIALAIPFSLFALFPSAMSKLPKSGGWLNSVKVVLGFLELAFALKFLSNVDLAYHWEWFDREVFLALWIIIFALMGFYLLGKIRFSHDSKTEYISVPRLLMAVIVLAFTIYLIPGMWGAPLKSVSAFLPPQETQDFDLYTSSLTRNSATGIVTGDDQKHKYADKFKAPLNLNAFFDYKEGIEQAKKLNKPVLIDFTGHACVNCRKMEANVWPDKEIYKHISQDYVLIQLYVDDKSELSENDIVTTPEGRKLNTIGKKWSDLQTRKFKANSQPFYVLLDPNTEDLLSAPQGADYDVSNYKTFLEGGLISFKKMR